MFDLGAALNPDMLDNIWHILTLLTICSACAGTIFLVYRRTSADEADEREFSSTILVLSVATAFLISIARHVPTISLGLFGAMSIVHFRTPVKRPREMLYLFIASAIGVCCGVGEYVTTVLGTAILSLFLLVLFRMDGSPPSKRQKKAKSRQLVVQETLPPGAARGWSIDFAPLMLANGKRARILAVLDENSHEALALIPDTLISGSRVVGELDRLIAEQGAPDILISETWPELGSPAVRDWLKSTTITWHYIGQPPRRTSEPYILTFMQALQAECLSRHALANLVEARIMLEIWRATYNEQLPHLASAQQAQDAVPLRSSSAADEVPAPPPPASAAQLLPSFFRNGAEPATSQLQTSGLSDTSRAPVQP